MEAKGKRGREERSKQGRRREEGYRDEVDEVHKIGGYL
jgi:hypothetical protein